MSAHPSQVCGIYAYATRKASNWVPDALYEIALEAKAKARRVKEQQQQQQVGQGRERSGEVCVNAWIRGA